MESSIIGNGISDTNRVNVSIRWILVGENTFETTVTFSHLLEADAGAYNCSAYTTSPLSVPNVITSDSTSASESISVGHKCIKVKLIILIIILLSLKLQVSKLQLSLSFQSKEYLLKLVARIP